MLDHTSPHAATGRRILGGLIGAALAALALGCTQQSPNGEALHRAVLRGDMAEAQRIVQQDPSSVRATDAAGMTALHFAVARLRVSPEAVEAPAVPPSGEPSDRPSPGCATSPAFTTYDFVDMRRGLAAGGAPKISMITTLDYAPMAEMLISHGARVNAKEGDLGRTPLHLASTMGHMSVAQVLLAHGADVSKGDKLGLTALDMVAMSGNVAIARLLLDHGADPNAVVRGPMMLPVFRDDTPLLLATGCSRTGMMELLLEHGADPNHRNHDGFAPLHLAERADVAALLLAHGANLSQRGYENRTPLHQAAMQARLDVAELLLAHRSDIEAKDKFGRTPLFLAVSQPNASPEMTAFLIRNGAQVNVRSSEGQTPLLAALSRNPRTVEVLLAGGADVNAPDRYGRTALHWAVEGNDRALVALLIAHGANVNALDATKHTPLYYTWGGSAADQEIAAMLRQAGAR